MSNTTRLTIAGCAALLLAAVVAPALAVADPCGMVPPIQVRHDPDRYLTRTGDQLTWVFFKDGVEDVMLRPAFEGRVSEFGMLITLANLAGNIILWLGLFGIWSLIPSTTIDESTFADGTEQ